MPRGYHGSSSCSICCFPRNRDASWVFSPQAEKHPITGRMLRGIVHHSNFVRLTFVPWRFSDVGWELPLGLGGTLPHVVQPVRAPVGALHCALRRALIPPMSSCPSATPPPGSAATGNGLWCGRCCRGVFQPMALPTSEITTAKYPPKPGKVDALRAFAGRCRMRDSPRRGRHGALFPLRRT